MDLDTLGRAIWNANKNIFDRTPDFEAMGREARRLIASVPYFSLKKNHLPMCDCCERRFSRDNLVCVGDFDFCKECEQGWLKTFNACKHAWEPYDGEFGVGRYCGKCGGVEQFNNAGGEPDRLR